jgi:hypothetical protein
VYRLIVEASVRLLLNGGAKMANEAVFLSSIPIDAANITADTEVASLPVTNLQYAEPERVWRAESNSPYIVGELTDALAVNGVAITAHNGSDTAEWKIVVGPTEASVTGGSPTYDSGFVSMWPDSGKPEDIGLPHLSSLHIFDNDTDVNWFAIYISDPANADDFEAGRVMVDRSVRIKLGIQVSLQVSTTDDPRITEFNRFFGDVRGPNSRKMLIPMPKIDKDDFRASIFKYQLKHGRVKDFFFCANPNLDEDLCLYSMQATFGDMTSFNRQSLFNANGATFAAVVPLLEQT